MSSQTLNDELFALLKTVGDVGEIVSYQECPTCSLALRTPCYLSFFTVITECDSLLTTFKSAQSEIASLRSAKGQEWPRDLNLVLVCSDVTNIPAVVRGILDDRNVCRKFIVNVNGTSLEESFNDLPFWPADERLIASSDAIVAGVQQVLSGYDPDLVSDLVRYAPGAQRIFEKILEGKYSTGTEIVSTTRAKTTLGHGAKSASRLSGLEIVDFRGVRKLSPEQMPLDANIVIIYGPNGVGKTSITDAIEWAVTGQIQRLSKFASSTKKIDPVVNLLSSSGEAGVTCHFRNRGSISRIRKGTKTVRKIAGELAGDDRSIIDHVVGTAAPKEAQLRIERLRELFRSSHMLSQHDIRHFLEDAEPTERFDILTNMIGAEEFVRFRKKANTVANSIRTHLSSRASELEFLNKQVLDISERLAPRRASLSEALSRITEGICIPDIIREMVNGLAKCECKFDPHVFQVSIEAPTSTSLNIAANEANRVIRDYTAYAEESLTKLQNLSQQIASYKESKSKQDFLNNGILALKRENEKLSVNLRENQALRVEKDLQLQQVTLKKNSLSRELERCIWLSKHVEKYLDMKSKSQQLADRIEGLKVSIQGLESSIQEASASHEKLCADVAQLDAEIANKTKSMDNLQTLAVELQKYLDEIDKREQVRRANLKIESQLADLNNSMNEIKSTSTVYKTNLQKLEQRYSDESTRHDEMKALLARLSQFISSAECPLCGKSFSTIDEAKEVIARNLRNVSPLLQEIAKEMESLKKQLNIKVNELNTKTKEIQALESTKTRNTNLIAIIDKAISDYIIEFSHLGISLPRSEPSVWSSIIKDAEQAFRVAALVMKRKDFAASTQETDAKIAKIRMQLRVATEGLKQEEISYDRLLNELQEIEASMREYAIDSAALPKVEQLVTRIEAIKSDIKILVVNEKEMTELIRAIDLEIEAIRKKQHTIEQDIVDKQGQMLLHKRTTSDFERMCQSMEIDIRKPGDVIALREKQLATLLSTLRELKGKAALLDHLGILSGLEKEVAELTTQHEQLSQRLSILKEEHDKVLDWKKLFADLDRRVTSSQVDVVTSHLKRLEPTTQRLYQRLNPHPLFGKLAFSVDEKTRMLDINVLTTIPISHELGLSITPSEFFSDAQLNSLALTVFLGGALRQCWSTFETLIIDDPIQQMDELNVYSLIDLLRGLSFYKQFIILTCSQDFYLLAMEKLECLNRLGPGSFLAYRLSGIAPARLEIHNDVA